MGEGGFGDGSLHGNVGRVAVSACKRDMRRKGVHVVKKTCGEETCKWLCLFLFFFEWILFDDHLIWTIGLQFWTIRLWNLTRDDKNK